VRERRAPPPFAAGARRACDELIPSAPMTRHPADFLELVERGRRGRLKLYIGSAPGVGKTHRMLQEAQALRLRGVDVVLGFVDPRGRPETAALALGLEVVPLRRLEFRGFSTEDLAIDAVLARHPEVVLIDDIAHTNPPDSRNARRYEDVLELLDAGIHVIGALGVQHLESLNDLVHRITGVQVHDTVPDTFVKKADQVVNIDVPVEELLERLHAGRILSAEAIPSALEGVFRPECLQSLRELALREVAETLDRRGPSREATPSQVAGRIMVCLSSSSPRAAALLRRGSRFAGRLATDWFVVYVETPAEAPGRISPHVQASLVRNVERARELGAEVVRLKARDSVRALVDFARSHGVATLLVGKSQRSFWSRLVGGSPADRLLREASEFDLYLVAEEDGEVAP